MSFYSDYLDRHWVHVGKYKHPNSNSGMIIYIDPYIDFLITASTPDHARQQIIDVFVHTYPD